MTPRTFLDGPSNSVSVSLLLHFELRTVAAVGGGRERSTEGNTATGKEGMRQRCRSLARPFADCSRPTYRPTEERATVCSIALATATSLPREAGLRLCMPRLLSCLPVCQRRGNRPARCASPRRASEHERALEGPREDHHRGQPRGRLDGEPKE